MDLLRLPFSFSPADIPDNYEQLCRASSAPLMECQMVWTQIDHIKACLKKNQEIDMLDEEERDLLRAMYQSIYPNDPITMEDVGEFCYLVGKIYIENTRLVAVASDRERHCMIMAYWPDPSGLINEGVSSLHMGRIKTFLRHTLRLNGVYVPHILCEVDWKREFEDSMPHGYLQPALVYRKQSVFRDQPCVYMPVQRIHSICVHSYQTVNGYKDCIVVVPNQLHLLLSDM